jgi:hypothetical protein
MRSNGPQVMKSARINLYRNFPETPMSGRAGARYYAWVQRTNDSGQPKSPERVGHPFLEQRKSWCLLSVHFNGVDLRFAMIEELDLFLNVMSRNPLPSGYSLVPDCAIGRPSRHWLARLPKQAKSWKFRKALCDFLRANTTVQAFRAFYERNPVKFHFEGVDDSYTAARASFRSRVRETD